MEQDRARQYLQDLYELSQKVQVNDDSGKPLPLDGGVARAVVFLSELAVTKKKALLVGNGGSASIASHMQADLCNSAAVRALVFMDGPMVTATSNDCGYGSVFEKPSRLWLEDGDLLIAISSSGRSENILRAVQTCSAGDCRIITFSGFDPDNPLRGSGHLNFYVPSHSYGYVEVVHSTLVHMLTDFLIRECRDRIPESAVWSWQKVH